MPDEKQAPHSDTFTLVCLHGPCMRAGPGAEDLVGDGFNESVCFLMFWSVRVLRLGPNNKKTKQNKTKMKNL